MAWEFVSGYGEEGGKEEKDVVVGSMAKQGIRMPKTVNEPHNSFFFLPPPPQSASECRYRGKMCGWGQVGRGGRDLSVTHPFID